MKLQTRLGIITGEFKKGLYLFKGIPYAKAGLFEEGKMINTLNEFDATQFGKKAYQNPYDRNTQGQDCLNLNIYTPKIDGKLPVLVEFHGGAFQTGNNQKMDPYHVIGDDQFVYVTINYRLGIFGYLYVPKINIKSGNLGTLDQLMALRWIKKYIEEFGGDPSRITVLGSSAGAKAIGALMGIPESKTLFNQVILMSGAHQASRDQTTAKKITQHYLEILDVQDEKELLNYSIQELLDAQQKLCSDFGSTCKFGPVLDDVVLPTTFYQDINQNYWQGNAMIGSSLHEMGFFAMFDANFDQHDKQIAEGLFGKNASIALEDIQTLEKTMSKHDALIKAFSDYMYRTYSYRLAEMMNQQGSTVYLYSMRFLPALHCFDHILALEDESKLDKYFPNIQDKTKIKQLGQQMRRNYVEFIIHGKVLEKDWLPLSQKQCEMQWDEPCLVTKIDQDVLDHIGSQVFKL